VACQAPFSSQPKRSRGCHPTNNYPKSEATNHAHFQFQNVPIFQCRTAKSGPFPSGIYKGASSLNKVLEYLPKMNLHLHFLPQIAYILFFTPLVTPQTIAQEVALLPSCSIICLATAVAVGGCTNTDYACQCGSASSKIRDNAKTCLASACSAADIASKSRKK